MINRYQPLKVNDTLSIWSQVKQGVQPETVLPLFHNLYVNDLHKFLNWNIKMTK